MGGTIALLSMVGGVLTVEHWMRQPRGLDVREVQRRIEGHEHAWSTMTTARNMVRFERCASCGLERTVKGAQ